MQKYDAVTITKIMLPNVVIAHVVEALGQLLAVNLPILVEVKLIKQALKSRL